MGIEQSALVQESSKTGKGYSGGAVQEEGKNTSPEYVVEKLKEFDLKSKSGVGVHVFRFKKPRNFFRSEDTPERNESKYFIGSEVTDTGKILDVKYSMWKKFHSKVQGENDTKLKPVWRIVHKFSNGRVAMLVVKKLLQEGYEMKLLKE